MSMIGSWKRPFRFVLNDRYCWGFDLRINMSLLGFEESHFLEIKCKDLGFRIVMLVKLFNLTGI